MSIHDLAPLASKLGRLGLEQDEQSTVLAAVVSTRRCNTGELLVRQGDAAPSFIALLTGLAARFKMGPDGTRQILAFCIPGDLCTLQVGVAGWMDHGLVAIGRCTFAVIPARTITALVEARPKLAIALWRDTVADAAVEREWLYNLGRRSAVTRLAHLLCEVHHRLESAGLTPATSFDFSVTQTDLADAMGLSTVHVNRSVQALKRAGLATFGRGRVTVLDRAELVRVAGFDAAYLGVERRHMAPPPPLNGRNPPAFSDARI